MTDAAFRALTRPFTGVLFDICGVFLLFLVRFFGVEALVIISRGCDLFPSCFLFFFAFFFGEIVSIIVLLIFPEIDGVDFFVWASCALSLTRVYFYLLDVLIILGADLICCVFRWLFDFFWLNFQYYLLTICRCLILSSRRVLPCCWTAFASAYEMYVLFWVHA